MKLGSGDGPDGYAAGLVFDSDLDRGFGREQRQGCDNRSSKQRQFHEAQVFALDAAAAQLVSKIDHGQAGSRNRVSAEQRLLRVNNQPYARREDVVGGRDQQRRLP